MYPPNVNLVSDEDWCMQFHPAKCTVLTVTNKRNPIVTEYTIRGQLLAAVTSAKYLGVTITDKVNWSQHIDSITNKANIVEQWIVAGLGGH
jgi:hypothetical protein